MHTADGDPRQKALEEAKQKAATEERKRRAEFAFVDRGEEFFWVTDAEEAYRPAKVVEKKKDGSMLVEYTGGSRSTKTVSKDDIGPRISRPESLRTEFDDMVRMEDVNVATILHNLRMRFKADRIYTNIGKCTLQYHSLSPRDPSPNPWFLFLPLIPLCMSRPSCPCACHTPPAPCFLI